MRVAHILHALDPALGGLTTVLLNVARATAAAGVDVEVWTADAHGVAGGERLEIVERPGPLGAFERGFVQRFAADVGRVDVLHTHSFWRPHVAGFAAAAARAGTPVVHTMHGMLMDWPMRQKTPKKRVYLALAGRRALGRIAAVHMLNRCETEQSRRVGADFRYFELPNGVDPRELAALPPRGAYRATEPLLEACRLVLSLGRLHHVKGPELLLGAFLDVADERDDVALVMAGPDEGMLDALKRRMAGRRGAARVRLPGLVRGDGRLALLADADVFAQTSYHETMSMSIIEAAYAGRPLLVTETCNCPEVGDAGAGLVVAPTPEAVRDGLRELLDAPAEALAERGARARRLVQERFTLEAVTPRLVEHYERVRAGGEYPRVLG